MKEKHNITRRHLRSIAFERKPTNAYYHSMTKLSQTGKSVGNNLTATGAPTTVSHAVTSSVILYKNL